MSDTQNVLDQMTSGIMQKKAAKTTKLTPVGSEITTPTYDKAVLDQKYNTPFPYDQPDMIQKALADARTQVVFVLEGIDQLIASFGQNPYQSAAPDSAALTQQATERAADERVAAVPDYAQLQQEAQASLGWVAAPATTVKAGWACSAHPDAPTNDLTSKKGRHYKTCTLCEEFER